MNPCFRYKLLVYLVANVMSKNTGETVALLLDHIQEVEITGLTGSQHEVTLLKHIFWSPPCPPSPERPHRATWGRPRLRPRPLYLRLPSGRRHRLLACGEGTSAIAPPPSCPSLLHPHHHLSSLYSAWTCGRPGGVLGSQCTVLLAIR